MAAIEHIQGLARNDQGLSARLSAFFAGIQESRARNAVYRQSVRELNALTERDLADLGILRSAITLIASEATFGPGK